MLLLEAGVYAGFRLGRSSDGSNLAIDPNALTVDKDYQNTLQCNPSTANQGNFIYHLFTDVYFICDAVTQDLPAWNDAGNTYNLMIMLTLSEEEEPLVVSCIILPGQMLSSVNLAHELATGDYNPMFVCTLVDDYGNAYGSLSANVIIHVVNSD